MSTLTRRCLLLFAALALLATLSDVRLWAAPPAPQPFQAGDRVCFIGDSITHNGKYTALVYLYYATRFPDRELRMYNCGISGDSAAGAVRRFDWDIAVHKPTAATVLLGMNDVGRTLYGRDKTAEKNKKAQQAAIASYAANMAQLAELLKKGDVRTTWLTPTIYEQNADTGTENLYGCDEGLANCGREALALAAKYNAPSIDIHSEMGLLNAKAQKLNKTFTLVGPDRVHPGDIGHLVVAYLILRGQNATPLVAKIGIDAEMCAVRESGRCQISKLKATPTAVSFDCLEQALPFPVPEAAAPALKLISFDQDLNQELLQVEGLFGGTYELLIDGSPVAEYDAAALKTGVNLATCPKTPQYAQAKAVAELNAKRQMLESSRLRTFAQVRHWHLAKSKISENDAAAVKAYLMEQVEKGKGSRLYGYNKSVVENYLKYKPTEKETVAEVEATVAEMYRAAQPKPHHYELRRK